MRSFLPLSFLFALTVCLTSTASPRTAAPAEGTQVINVTAKKYEFDPSPIRVKQGTRVQLKITASDHVHGFKISDVPDKGGEPGLVFDSRSDCVRIEEGKTETVEFLAKTPGTYSFRCCVHCGWHHRGMKGQLIVEP
jgi:heme/copper-type cytochrome/quinol oxidase subunit 2